MANSEKMRVEIMFSLVLYIIFLLIAGLVTYGYWLAGLSWNGMLLFVCLVGMYAVMFYARLYERNRKRD